MKTEYKTQSGKQVVVEIVTSKVVATDEMAGEIRKECYEMRITVDGNNKTYHEHGGIMEYQGQIYHVVKILGGKLLVAAENWNAVKTVLDTYQSESARRNAAADAQAKKYEDHADLMRRAMNE